MVISAIASQEIRSQFKVVVGIWSEYKQILNSILSNPSVKIDSNKLSKNIALLKASNKAVMMMEKELLEKNNTLTTMIIVLIVLGIAFFIVSIVAVNKAVVNPRIQYVTTSRIAQRYG